MNYDIAVVGGGPVGCVAALAFARKGARVVVLEANPKASHRLAGEWLHPPAVAALKSLGVDTSAGWRTGEGFAVFPEDGSESIVLPYVGGGRGLGLEHHILVDRLREAVRDKVTFLPWAKVTEVEDGRLSWTVKGGQSETARVGRILGADGRKSVVRASLGVSDDMESPSRMAGIVLSDVTLPHEGCGHVFLGGPGPVLGYRIGDDSVRLCIDIPNAHFERGEPTEMLRRAFTAALPAGMHGAWDRALAAGKLQWAANQVRPRLHYGTAERTLIGDSVGHYHPFTAVGMTLGFVDAVTLAEARDFETWRQQRQRDARVPSLLAIGLYDVFREQSDVAGAMRQTVYATWRDRPAERSRTMRYLACDDTHLGRFGWSFSTTLARAGVRILADTARTRQIRRTTTAVRDLGTRAWWITHGVLRGVTPSAQAIDSRESA